VLSWQLPLSYDVRTALGNGTQIIAQDTVPFCLWSAARYLDDYEFAMWTTSLIWLIATQRAPSSAASSFWHSNSTRIDAMPGSFDGFGFTPDQILTH
jgi:hypothetical protein